jgi:cytidylate kinase
MKTTEYSLYDDYENDKQDIEKIDKTVADVIGIFINFFSEMGWAYEIIDGLDAPKKPKKMSLSTCSMISHSMLSSLGNIKDSYISSGISQRYYINNLIKKKLLTRTKVESYENVIKDVFIKMIDESRKLPNEPRFQKASCKIDKNNVIFYSRNFGVNDPFTYSWFLEVMFSIEKTDKTLVDKIDKFEEFKTKAINIIITQIEKVFESLHQDSRCLYWEKDHHEYKALEHAFPLLRTINIFLLLIKNINLLYPDATKTRVLSFDKKYKLQIAKYTLNRVLEQLALYDVKDSEFDVAELVLSLESYLLVVGSSKIININLVNRVFEIVQKSQSQSAYWRPLKPFVTTSSGLVLLPLSIEIVNSLLRICKIVDDSIRNEHLFSKNVDIFKRYNTWLLSRIVKGKCTDCNGVENQEFQGWHSENVLDQKKIHPWDTSQILLFLMLYQSSLHRHIAHRVLINTNLDCERINRDKSNDLSPHEYWKENWQKSEPLDGLTANNYYRALKKIGEKYIVDREPNNSLSDPDKMNFSMLLYGPPGTGKSTIAEEIAKSLEWNLITITPSNFIAKGESEVENRANQIFRALMEQDNCVIFFDEIDRLILDRESDFYLKQSDIFQFMTPGMLVKIRNLRKNQSSIFIIATNYEDRIDHAIKRRGRIDEKYFISPPDLQQRLNIIKKLIKRKFKDDPDIDYNLINKKVTKRNLKDFLKNTVFYQYGELEHVIYDCIDEWIGSGKGTPSNLTKKINSLNNLPRPELSLEAYKKRFECLLDEKQFFLAAQEPHEELFLLYKMVIEESEPDYAQKEMFDKIVNKLVRNKLNNPKTLQKTAFDSNIGKAISDKIHDSNICSILKTAAGFIHQ